MFDLNEARHKTDPAKGLAPPAIIAERCTKHDDIVIDAYGIDLFASDEVGRDGLLVANFRQIEMA